VYFVVVENQKLVGRIEIGPSSMCKVFVDSQDTSVDDTSFLWNSGFKRSFVTIVTAQVKRTAQDLTEDLRG